MRGYSANLFREKHFFAASARFKILRRRHKGDLCPKGLIAVTDGAVRRCCSSQLMSEATCALGIL